MFSLMSLPKLVAALCVASLSMAAYVIDDTNTTIQYVPGGRQVASGVTPSQWHIAQAPEVNISASYDDTSTVGECNTSQNCYMTIPFQGSGITLYVVQVNYGAINCSIQVDNLTPVLRTYSEPQYYLHNFQLFEIQELPTGPHNVTISLLDNQYSSGDRYAYTNGTSVLVFDYAIVNEQNIGASSTPSAAPPSQTSSSSSSSKTPIGAIVGGVVGGLAVLTVALLLFLCRHRIAASSLRRRRTEIDPEPKGARRTTLQDRPLSPPSTFNAQALYRSNSHSSLTTTQAPYPQSIYPGAGEMSEAAYPQTLSGTWSSTNGDRSQYASGGSAIGLTAATEAAYARFSGRSSISDDRDRSGVSGQAPSSAPLGLRSGGIPSPARSSVSQSVVSRALSEIPSINAARASQLTAEQLDFVHNLIGLNVPAADIAGVMERMRLEGEDGEANRRMGLGVERGVLGRGDVKTSPTDEPLPDYEPPSR